MAENQALASVVRFVAALHDQGVRQVCISPGSRSTPITMAIARHGGFQVWSILDERSAGFFAVGVARASGEPVVLVCTSGTAVGNYLPAVMEAGNARLPLLVLTADRPPELHGVGANQTVEQAGLFRAFTRLDVEMPVPGSEAAALRHAESAALRATACLKRTPGPVHVNWPLREPLIPPATGAPVAGGATLWQSESPSLRLEDAARLADLFQSMPHGLIVVGPLDSDQPARHVVELADRLGWPVLADPLSQVRGLGAHPGAPTIIDGFDAFFRSERIRQAYQPQLVLRFGRTPTSKVLGQYLQSLETARQFVVDDAVDWHDPFFAATDLVACNPVAFCQQIFRHLSDTADRFWLSEWQRLNRITQSVMQESLEGPGWWEGRIYAPLLDRLPSNANLFVGNSMPVRDLDSFMHVQQAPLRVFANRGVSGIDGVTSAACGVAAATKQPTVLVIGDVSFYHDLTALLLPSRLGLDLLVVVANNDGGGIFSFLPQRAYPETFAHFGTPHGLTFAGAAKQFGAWYAQASDRTGYEQALDQALSQSGLRMIELTFAVDQNLDAHRKLFADVVLSVEGECLK